MVRGTALLQPRQWDAALPGLSPPVQTWPRPCADPVTRFPIRRRVRHHPDPWGTVAGSRGEG
eukprot:10423862-Alexandrium_andersonii.AAC.1